MSYQELGIYVVTCEHCTYSVQVTLPKLHQSSFGRQPLQLLPGWSRVDNQRWDSRDDCWYSGILKDYCSKCKHISDSFSSKEGYRVEYKD